MPKAEAILWALLNGRKMLRCKFRRQYGLGGYRLDFYCAELRLAIELDGETHFVGNAHAQDRRRQQFIESFGIRLLRFLNDGVYHNVEGVWEAIARTVRDQIARQGPHVPRGRRVRRGGQRDAGSEATPPAPPY